MTKKNPKTGQLAQEVVHVPAGDFEFVEGPQDGYEICANDGHLIRVIPGSDNGHVELWDGPAETGTHIGNLHLEMMHGAVEYNIHFESCLTLVMDDDAKITVIHDHA